MVVGGFAEILSFLNKESGERWTKKKVRRIGEETQTRKTKRKREINKILDTKLLYIPLL